MRDREPERPTHTADRIVAGGHDIVPAGAFHYTRSRASAEGVSFNSTAHNLKAKGL